MTGNGSRFKDAGYKRLKPFIEVHGQPLIEWIVKLFPEDKDKITFICQSQHLNSLNYIKPELARIAPAARVFAIDDWKKKGPVADILSASEIIDDNKPVLISYSPYAKTLFLRKFVNSFIDAIFAATNNLYLIAK